ncbi:hypothetical protein PEC331060_30210 [Pectobacterium carotovorum subsp. carotovorum]|nr:hypothetical protein PEC331060_30210 [Pectobacterium carotovorum subsp. carotovorum]
MAPYSDSKNKHFVVANRCVCLRYFYKTMNDLTRKGGANGRPIGINDGCWRNGS